MSGNPGVLWVAMETDTRRDPATSRQAGVASLDYPQQAGICTHQIAQQITMAADRDFLKWELNCSGLRVSIAVEACIPQAQSHS